MSIGKLRACALALCAGLFAFSADVSAQQTTTYVYDEHGRIIRVTHPNNTVTTYAYDAAGNRTSATAVANGVAAPNANPDTVDAYPLNFYPFVVTNAWAYISPLGNDSDPAGNPLSIGSYTQGANGGAVSGSGVSVGYQNNATTDGVDTFTYTASNGHVASSAATITVNRHPQAASPYALNDVVNAYPINACPYFAANAFVHFDPRANDYDYNGYALTITSATPGPNGLVSVDAGGGGITYISDASTGLTDTFTYTISNGHGGTKTGTVTVYRYPPTPSIHC